MPVNVSKFVTSDDEWEKLTDEEKAARIRSLQASTKHIREALGSDSEVVAAAALEAQAAIAEDTRKFREAIQNVGGGAAAAWDAAHKSLDSALLATKFDYGALFSLPQLPKPRYDDLKDIKIPTAEERHEFESSSAMLARLHARYEAWRAALPEGVQPAIYAVLANGLTVRVTTFAPEGHNGVAITGEFGGVQCMIVTHQASMQLICVAEPVLREEERKPIGFVVPRREGGS